MSKSISINVYDELIKAIQDLSAADDAMRDGKQTIATLSQDITTREREILEFDTISNDVRAYLDNYDFQDGCRFNDMQDLLVSVSLLRGRIIKMEELEKALLAYPDMYGLKKTTKACDELVVKLRNQLSLNEIGKAAKSVETMIEKLQSLQTQFANDGSVIAQINSAVEKDRHVLIKFKALYFELMQYVHNFPHHGEDNLAEVNRRILLAKEMEGIVSAANIQIESIRTLCNRHGKDKVVSDAMALVKEVYELLTISNADRYKLQLNAIEGQVRKVLIAFAQEKSELEKFQYDLRNGSNDMWKDDKEKIKSEIGTILSRDVAKQSFSIAAIKKKIGEAKEIRMTNIKQMTDERSWLLSDEYSAFHNGLLERYITYAEYKSAIDSVSDERAKEMAKKFFKVVGIIAAIVFFILAIKYIIMAIVGVIIVGAILKGAFSSSDD